MPPDQVPPPDRAAFVDLAFAALEAPRRPLDFALLLDLAEPADPEAIRAGVLAAGARFPRSTRALTRHGWTATTTPIPLESLTNSDVEAFLARPMLAGTAPLVQVGLVTDGAPQLVVRMHHALADLQSAVAWCSALLGGAAPAEEPVVVRTHPKPARLSTFAFGRPSSPLWAPQPNPTGRRRIHALRFPPLPKTGESTRNDLLAAITLELLAVWNRRRGAPEEVALWMPVNVRAVRDRGFGNGSSRIRIYRRPPWPTSLRDAAVRVREQVRWSKEHGEWAVPSIAERVASLPGWLGRPLVRGFARRPGVDMATTLCSHAERLSSVPDDALLPGVSGLRIVSHLYDAHPIVLAAVGFRGETHLTFTWDAGRYPPDQAAGFVALFEELRLRAVAEHADA